MWADLLIPSLFVPIPPYFPNWPCTVAGSAHVSTIISESAADINILSIRSRLCAKNGQQRKYPRMLHRRVPALRLGSWPNQLKSLVCSDTWARMRANLLQQQPYAFQTINIACNANRHVVHLRTLYVSGAASSSTLCCNRTSESAANIHARLASFGGSVSTLWKSISRRQVQVFKYGLKQMPRLKTSQFNTLLMKECGCQGFVEDILRESHPIS